MRERHVIFGTAGHVDHGKSSLVLALTGTDPDRLAEEKEREMTIDLGFAFLALPGFKEPVAIVDVPGHEMFVRNMVAGATGIDAAIFVVAADEGVMPQTVEHLDVLRFLRIPTGVIALTKIDKAAPERVTEATEQVRELVKGTFLESAPVVPVSSVTSAGLPALREELRRIASSVLARSGEGVFRLPIDRVFTLKGVGTVVTGTVISGSLGLGETVTSLPQAKEARARSLQVHNELAQRIFAGQRAAINLADVAKDELARGDVLVTPGSLAPTLMVDARLELSAKAPRPIAQRTRVRVHHGTREVMARVALLEADALRPGESALAQLRLESPLVAVPGDTFVIRSYSPMQVIGGGSVVDAHPPKRRKAAGAEEVARRENLPVCDVIIETLDRAGPRGMEFNNLRVLSGLGEADLRAALQQMESEGEALGGRHDLWFSAAAIREMQSSITARLARLHEQEPLRPFVALNAVAADAAPQPDQRECFRVAIESLRQAGNVAGTGEHARLSTHQPRWTGRFASARQAILGKLQESGLSVPSPQELAGIAGLKEPECERALAALAEAGELRLLAKGIYVRPGVFTSCRERVREFLAQHGKITVGQCRDLFGASRKYLLPFLEELDREGLTRREGDYRVLR